jgi:hypothetical protein
VELLTLALDHSLPCALQGLIKKNRQLLFSMGAIRLKLFLRIRGMEKPFEQEGLPFLLGEKSESWLIR